MIRILFLAANPTDQLRLQSRRELDQLRHALDAAPHGRRFHLIQEFAVAADQLQELLVRHQPQIVHFSGHGSEARLALKAICFHTYLDKPKPWHPPALIDES